MNRRAPALALAALAVVVSSAGAAQATPTPKPTPATAKPTPTPTQSDGTLQILTYRGYAEYGGTSPKVNWTGTFEKATGCRIARLDQVQTPAEMATRLKERAYDVVSAGPGLAGSLIADKQVLPIELAKVDGYTEVAKPLRDLTTSGGKVYGVPYLWGSHEFLYDASRIKAPGMEQVFASPKAALKNDPLTIADAALAAGKSGSPYSLTAAELGKAVEMLGRQDERVYWDDPLDVVTGFATGRLDFAQATPYLRLLLQTAGKPVKTVPSARTTGWVDSWMLGASGANLDCAYRWLSWTASADTQRAAAAWVGLAPANDEACKGKARRVCEAYGVGKKSRFDRIDFAVRPPGDCRPQERECTEYDTWEDRWTDLVS
ncbi:extracellular solute-binding protein [Nonomuraea endophytica]|uniref:Putative spermidine/putrescine transport system substrate-binding protein n=1 Tax=Nonomuraea endophytica TaxID=714136 RepID=A0A7W8A6U6_9ACTN|nr:extracellular solute-binding protein [Nonomuraea endophytica]MBB5080655.1 putative spermidine/putrescine transport system substrate-binding protein [Nonomuraea endophytica]